VAGYLAALGSGPLRHLDADAADAGEITISETLRLSTAQLSAEERAAEIERMLGGREFLTAVTEGSEGAA